MALVETKWVGTNSNIAAVYLANSPVNIFTYPLLQQYTQTLQNLKSDDRCRGVIVLSKFGKRNIFSAGFDLTLFAKVHTNTRLTFAHVRIPCSE